MKIVTFKNLTFETPLKEEEVMRRLYDNIQPSNISLFRMNARSFLPYTGELKENTFEVYRVISYKNSFLPVIKGEVKSDFLGTVIKVRVGFSPWVLLLFSIWFIGFFIAFGIAPQFSNGFIGYFPYIAITFSMVMVVGFTVFEINKVKKDFKRIFEAQLAKNN